MTVLHAHPYDIYFYINKSKTVSYPGQYIPVTHNGSDGERWTSLMEVICIDGANYINDTDVSPRTEEGRQMARDAKEAA